MANPVKETIKTTHKKDINGILDLENLQFEIEGEDKPLTIKELWKHFDGQVVKVSITNETEGNVDELEAE